MSFFFNDSSTTAIYTLSLHDALPILEHDRRGDQRTPADADHVREQPPVAALQERKSTRLNSSHVSISYAVFCLKKKSNQNRHPDRERDFQYKVARRRVRIDSNDCAKK